MQVQIYKIYSIERKKTITMAITITMTMGYRKKKYFCIL